MELMAFNKERDTPEINRWIHYRKSAPKRFVTDLLPSTGLIVPGKGAILYWMTQGELVFMDGIVTNPDLSPKEQEEVGMFLSRSASILFVSQNIKRAVGFVYRGVASKFIKSVGAVPAGKWDKWVWNNPEEGM